MTLAELRARLDALDVERRGIHEAAGEKPLTDEQQTRWDALDTDEADVRAQIAPLEEAEARSARVAESRAKWGTTHVKPSSDAAVLDARSSSAALRDDVVRRNADRIEGRESQEHFERLLKRHGGDRQWLANLNARSTDVYAEAWRKAITGRPELLTNEERAALAVGTNTQGGYLVPTHLDPTLILTNSGSSNVIRSMARVVTLVGGANIWHGVSTAGSTFSWDAELAEVSDDTPSVGTIAIPVYAARGLVQASIEAFEDITALTSDVMMLFADGRDRLEGAAHATGSGTGQPKGIVTALDASTTVEITSTTAATIGEVDLHALYKGVPIRWRNKGQWLLNPTYNLAVKRLGTYVNSQYSGDLREAPADRILGRPVMESDDMPATQTTTQLDNEIVYGDFSNYVIVDKPGSTAIEFIPHLFNTANNLPDGHDEHSRFPPTAGQDQRVRASRCVDISQLSFVDAA
jgi:HK97 family phage major capsid protein